MSFGAERFELPRFLTRQLIPSFLLPNSKFISFGAERSVLPRYSTRQLSRSFRNSYLLICKSNFHRFSGDGEIRTLDPLLARQVLSQLSYAPVVSHIGSYSQSVFFFIKIRQPPTLPYRLQHSTIGRLSLNHRVRDENGCVP